MKTRRYVYQVVRTNRMNGSRDSYYFASEAAAKKYKSFTEGGNWSVEIVKWPLFTAEDI